MNTNKNANTLKHLRLIAAAAAGRRDAERPLDGSGKDGVPGGQDQYRLSDPV